MVGEDRNLKKHILSEIQRLSREGAAPGKEKFFEDTRISEYKIQKYFGNYTNAVTEAGLTPNSFGEEKISHDILMSALAELTRQLGHFPSRPELIHARDMSTEKGLNLPSSTTFQNLGNNKKKQLELLLQWLNDNAEYQDVAEILAAGAIGLTAHVSGSEVVTESVDGVVVLSDSFLPPVVSCLALLAKGSPIALAACKEKSIDREFEDRVESAFKILGFAVDKRGYGYRDLYGIAKYKQGHWAIMYDAKKKRSWLQAWHRRSPISRIH